MDINAILFWAFVVDAVAVLCFGMVSAALVVMGVSPDKYWDRVGPAFGPLIVSHACAGAMLWAAGYFFGG